LIFFQTNKDYKKNATALFHFDDGLDWLELIKLLVFLFCTCGYLNIAIPYREIVEFVIHIFFIINLNQEEDKYETRGIEKGCNWKYTMCVKNYLT